MRFVFLPLGLAAGLAAGLAGKKLFEATWGAFNDEEPPHSEHRDVSLVQLAAALAIEGAIFRLAKGMADHGARRGFASVTGVWPGEEKPDPE
jgi:hypothetical protein